MSSVLKKSIPSGKTAQSQEILKCAQDPVYFLNKYCKVQHPITGKIPFKTYPFQNDCLQTFLKNKYVVVNKSRQLGLSTLVAGYSVWRALFRTNSNILVIATKLPTAKNFIRKCIYAIKNLPSWMHICDIQCNAQDVQFSQGSQIKAVPTSDDAGRSEALSLLIVDEAAHIKNFETLWAGLKPTLSTGGSAIIISSPLGTGNQFYQMCNNAQTDPDTEYKYVELPWQVHPDRDEEWFRKETKTLSAKKIAQEYECSFNASGDTFLDSTTLAIIREGLMPPIERGHTDKNLWIWKKPKEGHKYILSADCATGEGKDCSAFHVIDQTAGEVVAEYNGKEYPDRFAEMIAQVALKYNKAIVCPENNSIGQSVIMRLRQLKYPRLYRADGKIGDMWGMPYISIEEVKKIGLSTQRDSRVNYLTKLEEVFRNNRIKIYSSRTHEQLMHFVWESSTRASGAKGKNDDLVMALAIGMWLYDGGESMLFQDDLSAALLKSSCVDSVASDNILGNSNNKPDETRIFIPYTGNSYGLAGSSGPEAKKMMVNKNWLWLYK